MRNNFIVGERNKGKRNTKREKLERTQEEMKERTNVPSSVMLICDTIYSEHRSHFMCEQPRFHLGLDKIVSFIIRIRLNARNN